MAENQNQQPPADGKVAKGKGAEMEALSADERAELDQLREEQAIRNEQQGKVNPVVSAAARRAALERKDAEFAKAERARLATEEVIIRPGRTLFLEPNQSQPFVGGQKIMVTPEERAKLEADGHLIREDGSVTGLSGPKVYQEAGLLQGHAPGQGQQPEGQTSGKASAKR